MSTNTDTIIEGGLNFNTVSIQSCTISGYDITNLVVGITIIESI